MTGKPSRGALARRTLALILILGLALNLTLALSGCRPGPDSGPGDDSGTTPGDDGSPGDDGTSPGGGETPGDEFQATAACPLCGLPAFEDSLLHRPLAVVVDNADGARPQSGLNGACLTYEMLVEGGITRFVSFYLHNDASSVGPVRSLRPYMLDLTIPLGAVVAHVGGSPQGLADLAALKPAAMDIDALKTGGPFRQAAGRSAPYSTYTGTASLRTASRQMGYEGSTLDSLTPEAFSFAATADEAVLPTGQSTRRFTVTYAAARNFSVTYDYDTGLDRWMRYVDGRAVEDAQSGEQVGSSTVIVLFASSRTIPGDTEGRLDIDLGGSGQAKVFCLRKVFEARWSKSGRGSGFVFSDTDGNPVILPPGPVWVMIVPPGSTVSFQ